MVPAEITCARCGWRNEATARMCGGCGMPLTHNDTPVNEGATVAITDLPGFSDRTPPTAAANGANLNDTQPTPPTSVGLRPSAYIAAAPITPVSRPTTPPTNVMVGVATPPIQTTAPAPAVKPTRRWGVIWGRVAIIVVVALVALGALGYGSWGLFVAPSIHTSVDAELHTHFASLVNVFKTTSASPTTITVTNAQASSALGLEDSSDWLQNMQVQFDQDVMYVTYTFEGTTGDISTHLFVSNGRLTVAATTVNGYLAGDSAFAAIETGDQAEAAFNDALAQLPASETIQQVSVTSGHVTITTA